MGHVHIGPPSPFCSRRVVAGGGYLTRRPTESIDMRSPTEFSLPAFPAALAWPVGAGGGVFEVGSLRPAEIPPDLDKSNTSLLGPAEPIRVLRVVSRWSCCHPSGGDGGGQYDGDIGRYER